MFLLGLFIGLMLGLGIKSLAPSKTTKEKALSPSGSTPSNFIEKKPNPNAVSYERALELQERKIESKYLYPKKDVEDKSNYFYEKKVVITGIFYDYPDRNDLAKLFWEAGADIDTGIGKSTDCLIVGEDAGPSKLKKAEAQGVEIIYQDELEDLFF